MFFQGVGLRMFLIYYTCFLTLLYYEVMVIVIMWQNVFAYDSRSDRLDRPMFAFLTKQLRSL